MRKMKVIKVLRLSSESEHVAYWNKLRMNFISKTSKVFSALITMLSGII